MLLSSHNEEERAKFEEYIHGNPIQIISQWLSNGWLITVRFGNAAKIAKKKNIYTY